MAGQSHSSVPPAYTIYTRGMEASIPGSPLADLGSRVHQMVDDKFKEQSQINLEDEMVTYRTTCFSAILADFPAAMRQRVDDSLWNMHTKIHGRFRQTLNRIVRKEHVNSPAWRAVAKEYIVFIKASQAAYRSFLRDLDARYPGVSNLRNIAQAFSVANQRSTQQPSSIFLTQEIRIAIVDLTCETLLHLGDLSRWRYTGRLDNNAQSGWKNSAAFYTLAREVDPASGFPSHQLAALSLADNKIFYALNYLYESMCAQKVHPEAGANLDALLRKRLSTFSMNDGEVNKAVPIDKMVEMVRPKDGNNAIATLRAWFLQLHVTCYSGVKFAAHDEMETEVLWRLSEALKHGLDLDSTLFHMVIINTGAEYVAFEKAHAGGNDLEVEKNAQAYLFFVRHNVRTFSELLRHLHDRLEEQSREYVASAGQEQQPNVKIPPVSNAAMYSIRLYTLWFTQNWAFLQRCTGADQLDLDSANYIRAMFTVLASVLSMIYEQYPLSNVDATGAVDHLLKEEEATMGFLPLQGEVNKDVWRNSGGLKSVMRVEKTEAQQMEDHLVRFRDIFGRGVLIAQDEASPFILTESGKILYDDTEGPSELFSPTPAQEPEGEPFTPPPHPANGNLVRVADSTEDLAQYQALWLDGQVDHRLNPSAAVYEMRKQVQPLVAPTFAINEHMIRQVLFWTGPLPMPTPIVHVPEGWVAPKQIPMPLVNPLDAIWRNEAVGAEDQPWPVQPFGAYLYPDDGT